MTVLAWFRRRRDSPVPASAPAVAPAIVPSAAALDRAARWFAGEPPELAELARATLRALARATPRPLEGAPPFPPDAGWIDAALDRPAARPEPPAPPGAPGLPWRYLVFARVLCDALEAAHVAAWRAGRATRCPLTDHPDSYRAARPRVKPAARARRACEGLGALLAGVRLPEAGLCHVLAAMEQGVDWADAAAFWTTGATAAMPLRTTVPPSQEDERLTGAEVQARPATVSQALPRPASGEDAGAAASTLRAAVDATLWELVESERFNCPQGDGWHADGFLWVVAKPFAERLHARLGRGEPAEPLHRKTLYRQLAAQGLILPRGAQPVWGMLVGAPGGSHTRYASVLKLPSSRDGGPEPGPVYPGTLREAGAAGGAGSDGGRAVLK